MISLECLLMRNTDLFHLAFSKDRVYMKCLVYGIYFLEFVQSVLIVETGFRTFVTSYGDVQVFNRIETVWLSVPILTAIGTFHFVGHERLTLICHQDTFFVQGFYAHRISILARSKKIAAVIIVKRILPGPSKNFA